MYRRAGRGECFVGHQFFMFESHYSLMLPNPFTSLAVAAFSTFYKFANFSCKLSDPFFVALDFIPAKSARKVHRLAASSILNGILRMG